MASSGRRAIIAQFQFLESERANVTVTAGEFDLRSSSPFLTGNGFREFCAPNICDEYNKCNLDPSTVSDGACVFVKSDLYNHFVTKIAIKIPGRYVIVSHNGDLSAPDGQNDAPSIGMPVYVTSHILKSEYDAGRLIAHHGENLWWINYRNTSRPSFLHCLPIGLENRRHTYGGNLQAYIAAMSRNLLSNPFNATTRSQLPLLLVPIQGQPGKPDRKNVLNALKANAGSDNSWYTLSPGMPHGKWLDAIPAHRFVLAPFGHGLDTHRLSEILLMGGIPVTRRSTISSCFDDTDNQNTYMSSSLYKYDQRRKSLNYASTRGSLPIVILDSWQNLTRSVLESEWLRISSMPAGHWDWRRLFLEHWRERIGPQPPAGVPLRKQFEKDALKTGLQNISQKQV